MSKNPLRLKVAYLYPDLLQGFCNDANIKAFVWRAKQRNIEVSVDEICANDKIKSSKYDFYYIGGQNIQAINICNKHLQKNSADIAIAAVSGVPMLAIYLGYILFGNTYQLQNSKEMQGLGILDVKSYSLGIKYYSKVIGVCSFLKKKTIVGFEYHDMITKLNSSPSFLTLKKGYGNNAKDKTEGARAYNIIATYITSPILAQNPYFCDFLIANSLKTKYKCSIPLTNLCDDIEWYSHDYLLKAK